MFARRYLPLVLVPLVVLAGCSESEDNAGQGSEIDPASEAALNSNLMTDPDLADSNEAAASLSGTGNGAIPQIDTSPEAMSAARRRAAEMLGGPAPDLAQPHELAAKAAGTPAMVQAARAAVSPGGANCTESLQYSAAWAAKLPPAFPVYPRGNTMEAAGSDQGGCALRIVTFRTPIPAAEVLEFYAGRAVKAGFGVDHARRADDAILSGVRGPAAYVVYARTIEGGITEIDLVTTGR